MIFISTKYVRTHFVPRDGTIRLDFEPDAVFSWNSRPSAKGLNRNATDISNSGFCSDVWAGLKPKKNGLDLQSSAPCLRLRLIFAKFGLLCKGNLQIYGCRMENDDLKAKAARIREAIENGPAKQIEIADYCEVSTQSVGGWKKTGQITRDNLLKVSEITGYRYIWLSTGSGPKKFNDRDENLKQFQVAEESPPYGSARSVIESPAAKKLIDSLTFALANNRLSDESIGHLADFISSLATNSQKP
jgi:hypothetical protein